jgi:tRNA modification GTPase
MNDDQTIFALASGAGRAGVAVVRLSGTQASRALEQLAGIVSPKPRMAHLASLTDPRTDELIDKGIVLFFPSPASFTGEDVVEFQVHGGPSVVAALLDTLGSIKGLRHAEAGEFTRRAFENSKMDLTAVEGLADLIEAETVAQRQQAQRQMAGELGALYEAWRKSLLEALAHKEAAIDFADEDLPEEIERQLAAKVEALTIEIRRHLNDGRRGERLRDGLRLAILGAPNVGKSSLLNRLAQRDAAIVSETAGTTRDIIEVHLDLSGYPVTLSDTAGLRVSDDQIEAEGMRRAVAAAEDADLKLVVFDAALWPEDREEGLRLIDDDSVVIFNKVDKVPLPASELNGKQAYGISADTGEGLDNLLHILGQEIVQRWQVGATPWITRERHRLALSDCLEHLERFTEVKDPELEAEDLRLATRTLGRITGAVDVEDLLDVIFSDFCIGK